MELNKPSIDRKDSDGNYEFNNCQFIEHVDNVIKSNKKEEINYEGKAIR